MINTIKKTATVKKTPKRTQKAIKKIISDKDVKYHYTIGRRKESTAVVKLFPKGTGKINIIKSDGKNINLTDYFGGHNYLIENALYPFYIIGGNIVKKFDAEIKISGGGLKGQSEAIKLGFSRALVEYDLGYRLQLKPYGLLKRDPRKKERKKPGLKKARRAPQWSKR